jgi:hypothetical protein
MLIEIEILYRYIYAKSPMIKFRWETFQYLSKRQLEIKQNRK